MRIFLFIHDASVPIRNIAHTSYRSQLVVVEVIIVLVVAVVVKVVSSYIAELFLDTLYT